MGWTNSFKSVIYKITSKIATLIVKAVTLIVLTFIAALKCLMVLAYPCLFLLFISSALWRTIVKEVRRVEEENKLHDISQLHHCKVYQEP